MRLLPAKFITLLATLLLCCTPSCYSQHIIGDNLSTNPKTTARIALVNNLSIQPLFDSAINELKNAQAALHREYTISFGKDSAGNIIKSKINPGDSNSGTIPFIENRFADIHIHTSNKPPSSGDVYGFIYQTQKDSNYLRYIVTPAGQVYALLLTNRQAANHFHKVYPATPGIKNSTANSPVTMYQPTFPTKLIEELNELKGWHGRSEEAALALIFQKYEAGIVLLKRNTSKHFSPIHTTETKDARGNKK